MVRVTALTKLKIQPPRRAENPRRLSTWLGLLDRSFARGPHTHPGLIVVSSVKTIRFLSRRWLLGIVRVINPAEQVESDKSRRTI